MCRLFGFRSILSSGVHSSLIESNNALINQGEKHPDGWGISYYIDQTPHIIKSVESVIGDSLFQKVSGIVSSQTVLAHIRKATKGNKTILNCHPFQYGQWSFAHNGNIKNFAALREPLINLIDEKYRKYLLGETDSEVLFYYLLTKLTCLNEDLSLLKQQLTDALSELTSLVGELCSDENAPNTENFLSFILTNGKRMIAFHGGQPLFYSTHKSSCPESSNCPFYNKTCESPVKSGKINHFIVSSEPLNNENVWIKLNFYNLAIVDDDLTFEILTL